MNDAHLFSRERMTELSRLNEAERRVLLLLAEGHTAKSIATELETTPAAVNERLREARRKTGVGSSRELARLLKAQENRHEQMGVGKGPASAKILSQPDAELWRPQTGVLAMIGLFFVVGVGAVTLMTQQPTASTNESDPLIGTELERFPQPADQHARVRSEPRDATWAPQMEKSIRARVMQVPLVGKDGNVLRITCASTMCEIAGTLLAPANKADLDDPKSPISRTVSALQVPPLPDDLARLGLKNEGASFLSGKGKPDRSVFLLYYSRANAAGDGEGFADPLLGNIFAPRDPQKAALIPTTERDYVHGKAGESSQTEAALRQLHAQVRAQPRDEQAEGRLTAIYKSIHPIKLSSAPLRVLCSESVCEVATTTQVPTPQAEIDATLGEVQGAELRQRAEGMGLKPLYLWFGLHPSGDRAAYLGYWARGK